LSTDYFSLFQFFLLGRVEVSELNLDEYGLENIDLNNSVKILGELL